MTLARSPTLASPRSRPPPRPRYIDTRSSTSHLPYITPMAERACKEFPNGNGLLIGLGGGAFPLALRRVCPETPTLTVVDASADALFIARTFVYGDDGRTTKYEVGFGEDFISSVADATYDFVRGPLPCPAAAPPEHPAAIRPFTSPFLASPCHAST